MGEMKPAHHFPLSISYVSVARKIKLSPFLFTLFIFLLFFAYLYGENLMQLVGQFSEIDAKKPEIPLGESGAISSENFFYFFFCLSLEFSKL